MVSETHTAGNPRRGVIVGFAVAPDSANYFVVGPDTVFLWSAYGVQGPTAYVDTDNAFHTYDIKVVNHSAITVYQDNTQILAGSILASSNNADAPEIYWGDGTGAASATSEWVFFRHNANTVACGPAVDVGPNGGNAAGEQAISLLPYPNPSRGSLTLAIRASAAISDPAWVRIYDVTGRQVRNLVWPTGSARLDWDGRDGLGRLVGAGTYLFQLSSNGQVATGRAVLLR